jgi:lysylphosphatidylglycerol synthetase-like protein (DUF2156 family)
MTSSFSPTTGDIEQPRRLVLNFLGVFTTLFALVVIYLLSNTDYQRPPDQTNYPNERAATELTTNKYF